MTFPSRAAPSRVPKAIQPRTPHSVSITSRIWSVTSTICSTTLASRPENGRWSRPHLSIMTGIPSLSTNRTRPSPLPKETSPSKSSSSPETTRTVEAPSSHRTIRLGHGTKTSPPRRGSAVNDHAMWPSKSTSPDPWKPAGKRRPESSTRTAVSPTRGEATARTPSW